MDDESELNARSGVVPMSVDGSLPQIALWRSLEISLAVQADIENPFVEVELWADFRHESGRLLRRPAFWDGGDVWRVRFAPTLPGRWEWTWSGAPGIDASHSGALTAVVEEGQDHVFKDHGFWQMSPGHRSLVHADGTPAILAGDTAWGLPWRANPDDVREYAADRQRKGFNAALLMSIQPDMRARGPRDRTRATGFDVAFEDLPLGHLNLINIEYFQRLDELLAILHEYEIVPVLSPVFQGFGWKGLEVAGTVIPPDEYARYCRYLVARYGASPIIYLVGADGSGDHPQIAAGGQEVHEWDCYAQPTGVHYQPHGRNHSHQGADWLDFQWCQTGHEGEHVAERVADMWRNTPPKAVANAEPTYENSGLTGRASGWWQGHEAWSNLCAGGTMGVVYGAGSLWQWRLDKDEPGHEAYFLAPGCGWRESLSFEGSNYIGLIPRILASLPTTDMYPDWTGAVAMRGLRLQDGTLVIYRENGGPIRVKDEAVSMHYTVVDPRTGKLVAQGHRESMSDHIPDPGGEPRVYICAAKGKYRPA